MGLDKTQTGKITLNNFIKAAKIFGLPISEELESQRTDPKSHEMSKLVDFERALNQITQMR